MSLLSALFPSRQAPPPVEVDPDIGKRELEAYDRLMREQAERAQFERDRAARIAAYLQCTEEGKEDCRMDISWEEMARRGQTHG